MSVVKTEIVIVEDKDEKQLDSIQSFRMSNHIQEVDLTSNDDIIIIAGGVAFYNLGKYSKIRVRFCVKCTEENLPIGY